MGQLDNLKHPSLTTCLRVFQIGAWGARKPHEAPGRSFASIHSTRTLAMPSFASIAPDKLARLIGTSKAPLVVDVRDTDDLAADPRLIPTSLHFPYAEAETWASK